MAPRATRQTERVTIVDVAAAAGVSRQTVSNALNKPQLLAALGGLEQFLKLGGAL